MTAPFTPLDPRGAVLGDEVYARLGEAILDGRLAPGERLRDHELAERLGVSRTPVREALQRLERIGLVEVSPNRYTRVIARRTTRRRPTSSSSSPTSWAIAVRMAVARCTDETLADRHRPPGRRDRGIPRRRPRRARTRQPRVLRRRHERDRQRRDHPVHARSRDRDPPQHRRLAPVHRVPDRPHRGVRAVPGCLHPARRASRRRRAAPHPRLRPEPRRALATVRGAWVPHRAAGPR